ncbi:MAG: hypothetical protein M1837_006882 [Sclerophora amabilis]|nr:MAG: hypothetical protein M1837_006882 [Sclerophora amabilis]
MRLFLLPISTRRTLIYCQRINKVTSERETLLDKATGRASRLWIQWEKGEKKWQKSLTEYGNKLLQRISYEEWGLKSIPPLSTRRRAEELSGKAKVSVIFPPSVIPSNSISEVLRTLATERQALHRKRLFWSIAGMPLTAPVALIPISALSGSKHIEFLLDNSLLESEPSADLDKMYSTTVARLSGQRDSKIPPGATRRAASNASESAKLQDATDPEEAMVLRRENGRPIAEALDVPELHAELERAIAQVEAAIKTRDEQKGKISTADSTTEKPTDKRAREQEQKR